MDIDQSDEEMKESPTIYFFTPGNQHDTLLYSSSVVLKVWHDVLFQFGKKGILDGKLSAEIKWIQNIRHNK